MDQTTPPIEQAASPLRERLRREIGQFTFRGMDDFVRLADHLAAVIEREQVRPRAVDYAHLIGLDLRMERPATSAEMASGDPATHGMECHVQSIFDTQAGVEIVSDEGSGIEITAADQDAWRFWVTKGGQSASRAAINRGWSS